MALNLLSDPWIPVVRGKSTVTIRPDQIDEPGVARLAWPRPDLNLACLELLIGLVSMADPPTDRVDWRSRLVNPDTGRLRGALEAFAPHFELMGDGPRFLQDLEVFEETAKTADINPVDMLYIDSAGNSTALKNADLMVKRRRYTSLSAAEAAMALYTLQAFAPAGGSGNRTSMRGGGPMTTLVRPIDCDHAAYPLWRLVFANVLPGIPLAAGDAETALPWLRPTRTSKLESEITTPDDSHPLEAFFGMPRRLRLVFENDRVTGVVQRPYGTNYGGWYDHPLTPYYRRREEDPEWLPVHPRPGRLSYRNWLGTTLESAAQGKGIRRTARTIRECRNVGSRAPDFEVMAGGWAMDNMKPMDFSVHVYPGFPGLDEDGESRVHQLVEAANTASGALRKALKYAGKLDGASARADETFFGETEGEFEASVRRITAGEQEVEEKWHGTLRRHAVRIFDERTLGGLAERDIAKVEKQLAARRNLQIALARQVREKLCLPILAKGKKWK